jgi:FkbM family methyltransferase
MILKYYAEFNTDKFIRETYFPDFSYKGLMIEVGAGPTEVYSMSKHFKQNGWRCICIEPNPIFIQQHLEENNEIYPIACSDIDSSDASFFINNHTDINQQMGFSALQINDSYLSHHNYTYNDLNFKEIKIETKKLDTLLKELDIEKIDFLSIDVEGSEIKVMNGFNCKKYLPKVILMENYLYDPMYEEYMENLGYILDYKIKYNYIFKYGI